MAFAFQLMQDVGLAKPKARPEGKGSSLLGGRASLGLLSHTKERNKFYTLSRVMIRSPFLGFSQNGSSYELEINRCSSLI